MSQVVVVLRGLPGAGKSHRVSEISKSLYPDTVRVVSTDDYWMRPDGLYDWNPRHLARAHEWCYMNFMDALNRREHVIIDNTNMRHWEFQKYTFEAAKRGIPVVFETVGTMPASEADVALYASRNAHGVPLETIRNMNARWEP